MRDRWLQDYGPAWSRGAAFRAKPLADLDQNGVAGGVAESIVDRLEPVEVDQGEREARPGYIAQARAE